MINLSLFVIKSLILIKTVKKRYNTNQSARTKWSSGQKGKDLN